MSTVECAQCGSAVPAESRFCPECGRPLTVEAEAEATAAYEVPPRRLWPPEPLVLVAVLIGAGGVILLAGGEWAWGLVVLLLALLVFVAQREVERRAARATLASLRERLSARRDVLSVRSRGQLELFRARRELAELEARRARGYQDLGRAVFHEDDTATETARAALGELAERVAGKEAEIRMLVEQIDRRVRAAQAGVQPTERMEAPPEPPAPSGRRKRRSGVESKPSRRQHLFSPGRRDVRATGETLTVPSARRLRLLIASAGVVVLLAVPSAVGQSLYDQQTQLNEKISGLREQIEAAKHEEGVLTSEIAAASSEIASLEGDIGALSARVAELESELAVHRARLAKLEALFEEQTRELERLRREYGIAQRILETRLIELYQQGDAGDSLEVLLQVESLGDLLDQVEYFDSVGRQDRAISDQISGLKADMRVAREQTKVTKAEVAKTTAVLAEKTAEQVAARDQLVARQSALAAARAGKRSDLASVRSDEAEAMENLDALQAASAALTARIQAATAAPSTGGSTGSGVSSSGLIWPVSGVITSGYGPRWGRMHTGIDIAAPYGTPVRAAAGGSVIVAGFTGGYGNLVVIDHGNGIATAYAHLSAIYASGGTVSQGQSIGAVGSTGNSTGNHLHFEVRVNGSPVDPMGYL